MDDEARDAETVWWQVHGDKIYPIATALLQTSLMQGLELDYKRIVDIAATLVHEVTQRQEPY